MCRNKFQAQVAQLGAREKKKASYIADVMLYLYAWVEQHVLFSQNPLKATEKYICNVWDYLQISKCLDWTNKANKHDSHRQTFILKGG